MKDLKINFANVELNYMEENYSKPILFEPQDKNYFKMPFIFNDDLTLIFQCGDSDPQGVSGVSGVYGMKTC